MKKILTYGTFDLLHYGHIKYLKKAKALGDYLIVGLKTDATALEHGKVTYYNYDIRKEMLLALKYVDEIIEYSDVKQKVVDIQKYNIDTIVVSEDAHGDNNEYAKHCNVVLYNRSSEISTTKLKNDIKIYIENENEI